MNMKEQLDKIVSDDLINRWWYGQWGDNPDKREIMRDGLAQIAAGFSTGNTITTILRDLGLIMRSGITAKGRRYLFWANEYSIYIRRARIAELEAAHKCPDCGSPMVLECSGLNHTLSMLSTSPTPAPVDQSKYPYDRSEYVVLPPIRKAEDGTLTTEPQNVDDWEFFTDGAYWDMCAVRPIGDKSFNSPNLFHVSNLKEGERLASLLNSHCAYSPQPTQPPIDLEELKREICETVTHNIQKVGAIYAANVVSDIIDHLYSAGYLRAPLPRIEGALEKLLRQFSIQNLSSEMDEEALERADFQSAYDTFVNKTRAYLKASGV